MTTRTIRIGFFMAALCLLSARIPAADLPHQGMGMDAVRATFGNPVRDMGAVGDPPITRWVYDGYTVYFEKRRVIHTVRTQPLNAGTMVAPAPAPRAPVVSAPLTIPAPVSAPVEAPTHAPAPFVPAQAPALTPEPAAPAPESAPVIAPAPEPVQETTPVAPAFVAPAPASTPDTPAPTKSSGGFRFDPHTGRLIIDGDESETPTEAPAPAVDMPTETPAISAPAVEAPAVEAPASAEEFVAEPVEEPVAATAEDEAATEEVVEDTPAEEPVTDEPMTSTEATAAPAFTPAPAATPPPAASESVNSTGAALNDELEFDPETGTFRPKQ